MIARIWNAYRVELTKALRRKSSYTGLVLVVLVVACMPLVRPVAHESAATYGFIAYVTPLALNLLGLLVLLMFSASLVSSEVGNGAICMTLVRPLRRHECILAKLLIGMTYAVALTLSVGAAGWSIALALGDLTGVSYGGEVVYTNADMIEAYLGGVALVLLPQFAAVAYAVMISAFTRSTGAAIGGTVGIWIVADIVKHPFGVAPVLFSTYIESPWRVFEDRCDGLSPTWFPEAGHLMIVSILSLAVFTALAIAAFSRRDLRV